MNILRNIRDWYRGENAIKPDVIRDVLTQTAEEAKHSPDMADLEDYQKVSLFVCDELKLDKKLFKLYDAECKGIAYTRHPFSFWKKLTSEVQGIVLQTPDEKVAIPRPIRGELWRVPPDMLLDVLDKRYKNRYDFGRSRVTLTLPVEQFWDKYNQRYCSRIPQVRAHMYFGNPDVWLPQLEQGITEVLVAPGRTRIKAIRSVKVRSHDDLVGFFKPVESYHSRQNNMPDYYHFNLNGGTNV